MKLGEISGEIIFTKKKYLERFCKNFNIFWKFRKTLKKSKNFYKILTKFFANVKKVKILGEICVKTFYIDAGKMYASLPT